MRHEHDFKPGRGSVDVCDCGAFRHNDKAGPAIVEQRAKPQSVLIIVRQWSRPRYGGMYGTATVYVDGKFQHKTEENGGAETVHVDKAVDWLESAGYMPDREHYKNGSKEPGWRYFRERHGITFESNVIDVARERDL